MSVCVDVRVCQNFSEGWIEVLAKGATFGLGMVR
jgi:hypothetical protein